MNLLVILLEQIFTQQNSLCAFEPWLIEHQDEQTISTSSAINSIFFHRSTCTEHILHFSCSNVTIYRGTTRKSSTGFSVTVQASVRGGSHGLKELHTAENKKTPWKLFLYALGWKRTDSGSTSDWGRIKFYFSDYSWKNVIFLIELSLLSRLFSSNFFFTCWWCVLILNLKYKETDFLRKKWQDRQLELSKFNLNFFLNTKRRLYEIKGFNLVNQRRDWMFPKSFQAHFCYWLLFSLSGYSCDLRSIPRYLSIRMRDSGLP